MSGKSVCLWALVLPLLGVGAARGQGLMGTYGGAGAGPSGASGIPVPSPYAGTGLPPPTPAPTSSGAPGLSDWITYSRPECCGPFGPERPVKTEVYFRIGPSFILDGHSFDDVLETGIAVQGGARWLKYDTDRTAAWVVSLGITNIYNNGESGSPALLQRNVFVPQSTPIPGGQGAPVLIPFTFATVESLNRTFLDIGFGREVYLTGTEDGWFGGTTCRVGFEGGGRYGTQKLIFTQLGRRTDVIGGIFGAVYADMEMPYGCCVFLAGLRAELDYTWSDILQGTGDPDILGVNLLVNLGVRF